MRVSIRPATMEDADFLLVLKNDPVMRQFAVVTPEEIKMEDHLKWLQDHVNEMFIVELNGLRAGMFRVSQDREVSINLHPDFHGKGLGQEVVSQFCPKGVWAKIVNGNVPSMKLFLANGFKIMSYENNYYVLKN